MVHLGAAAVAVKNVGVQPQNGVGVDQFAPVVALDDGADRGIQGGKTDTVILVFNDGLTRLANVDRHGHALYDVEPGIAKGGDVLGQELEEAAGGPVLGVLLGRA